MDDLIRDPMDASPAEAMQQKKDGKSLMETKDGMALAKAVMGACSALLEEKTEDRITQLDRLAGDGDCGHTMASAARSVAAYVNAVLSKTDAIRSTPALANAMDIPADPSGVRLVSVDNASDFLRAISRVVGRCVGGTSGVLYSIMLSSFARHLHELKPNLADSSSSEADSTMSAQSARWVQAAKLAIQDVERVGGAARGDSTMLDAAWGSIDACEDILRSGGKPQSAGEILRAAAEGAMDGAKKTASMRAAAGRASYVGDHSQGIEDAGAVALALWVAGAGDGISI